jgi:hypothetical protein
MLVVTTNEHFFLTHLSSKTVEDLGTEASLPAGPPFKHKAPKSRAHQHQDKMRAIIENLPGGFLLGQL